MSKGRYRIPSLFVAILMVGLLATTGQAATLRLLCPETNPDTIAVVKGQIAAFEELNPGVTVEAEFISYQDVWQKVVSGVQTGNPPDIAGIEDQQLVALQKEGILLPVGDIVDLLGRDDYYPTALFAVTLDDEQWAVPYTLQTCATFYRADWYEEVGLEAPETWDDYLTAVQKITADTDGDGQIDRYGTNLPMGSSRYTALIFWEWLWGNGGRIFDQDAKVVLDQGDNLARAVETLKFWKAAQPYGAPGITQYTWYEVLQGYYSGRLAHSEYAPRLMAELQRYNPQLISPSITQAVAHPKGPHGDYTSDMIVKGWGMLKGTKNADIAKELVKFLLTPENHVRFAHTVPGHIMPPRVSIAESADYLSHPLLMANRDVFQTFTDLIDKSILMSRESDGVQYGSVGILDSPVVINMVQSVMINNADPEEAVKKAAIDIRKAGLGK